jgi:hypothetical protein
MSWKLICESGAMPPDEILLVAIKDFGFSCMISSNDYNRWYNDNNHPVTAHVAISATIDLATYEWVKVL